jgi:hypothetical protein
MREYQQREWIEWPELELERMRRTVMVRRKSKRLCVVRIGKLCCGRFYLHGTFRHFSACESSFFGNEALNKKLEFQIDFKTVQ